MTERDGRKSGPVPRFESSNEALGPFEPPIAADVLHALNVTVHVQNLRGAPDVGPKSRHLSRIAADLELALIERRSRAQTDRLCLDVAATALRILEQGDGH